MATTEHFSIDNVRFLYAGSAEISSHMQQTDPQVVGVASASVTCKACGEQWTAGQHGRGSLLSSMGHVTIKCPSCGANEAVRVGVLRG